MADTSIEWADAVWNPVVGCTPVSAGCLNCYAATMARRLEGMGKEDYQPRHTSSAASFREVADGGVKTHRIAEVRGGRAVFTGDVRLLEHRLAEPLRWRKPRRIFVCSMADLFHEAVPFDFVDRVFAVAALCPQHQFLMLTKRPERMAEYFNENDGRTTPVRVRESAMDYRRRHDLSLCWTLESWPLPNVWLGTSVEDQAAADSRIPHLLRCPAAVRFLSVEPMLGPVDLSRWFVPTAGRDVDIDGDAWRGGNQWDRIDWVIVGGESGAKARACDVAHVESVLDQCAAAGVACFVKQLGSLCGYTNPGGNTVRRWGDVSVAPYEDGVRLLLNHTKGGDPSEWPADLRVRQMPEVRRG